MKLIPIVAFMSLAAVIGIAFRQEASATPTPESVHQPQTSAEGCSCLTGGTCTCGNCQCESVETPESKVANALDALTKQLAESQAATDERIASIEASLAATDARITESMSAPTPAIDDERLAALEARMDMLQVADSLPMFSEPIVPETAADAQPTPYEVIFKAIDLLDLKNTETLLDFGCGGDARVLIHAFHDKGCRGIGVELDSDRAASARNIVSAAGLSPWITIVEGDATTEPVEGSVGFAYLWPETLEELRPKIQELERFVSYAHAVPGLTMQRIDVPGHEPLWYWERAPEVSYAEPEVSYSERPYAVYNGRRYYSDYNPGCNCSMCRTIRSQLASRENVEQIPIQTQTPTQSAPRTSTVVTATQRQTVQRSTSGCANCSGGNCGRPRFFRRR